MWTLLSITEIKHAYIRVAFEKKNDKKQKL